MIPVERRSKADAEQAVIAAGGNLDRCRLAIGGMVRAGASDEDHPVAGDGVLLCTKQGDAVLLGPLLEPNEDAEKPAN